MEISTTTTRTIEISNAKKNSRWANIAQTAWLVTAVVILILHWDEDDVCDEGFRQEWRWWLLVATMMPALYVVTTLATTFAMARKPVVLAQPQDAEEFDKMFNSMMSRAKIMGGIVLVLLMIQFIVCAVGTVFLIQSRSCDNAWDWPIYQMSLVSIVIADVMFLLWGTCFCMVSGCALVMHRMNR